MTDITGESGEPDELAGPSMQTECSGCNDLTLLMEALQEKCPLTRSRKGSNSDSVPAKWDNTVHCTRV